MCYVIITGLSLTWFLLSVVAGMLISVAIVSPKWLISVAVENFTGDNMFSAASLGINTRCKIIRGGVFHCGRFDLDGLATDSYIYPNEWKAAFFFMLLGLFLLIATVLLTLVTCCKQSIFGKSLHNITGCVQVVAGIFIVIAIFMHLLGWGSDHVIQLCGADTEAFYPGRCRIGSSLYCAVIGNMLCFICAGISLKAESANMRSKVRRRVEDGEHLVCIP